MADRRSHNHTLLAALAGGLAGIGVGAAMGAWWTQRVPGHIFRDGEDWYIDEPALRELQRRVRWTGETPGHDGYYHFSLFGHGSIKLIRTARELPGQSGDLYVVRSMLREGQKLELVMLDLVIHRVGKLKLIQYTPRPMPGRMVQGPGVGPSDRPEDEAPPGHGP